MLQTPFFVMEYDVLIMNRRSSEYRVQCIAAVKKRR